VNANDERWHIAANLVDGCLSGHPQMSRMPKSEVFTFLADRFRDKLNPLAAADALAYCICRIHDADYA
jgi:hypothetical protein